MSNQKILSIHGVEPMREGEFPLYYQIGIDGVTAIVFDQYSPEPFCSRIQYKIYKGDHHHSTVNDAALAEVFYSSTEEE